MDSQAKLLLVDDAAVNLEILIAILGMQYDLRVATDGESAIRVATLDPPDLILLDIVLPDIDGYAVCRTLKQNPATAAIPVLFITGLTDEASIESAYEVGGVDYITKPFRPREVVSRIANHLALANQQRLLQFAVARQTVELKQLNHELNQTQNEIVLLLGQMAERHSVETGHHVMRVSETSWRLALAARLSPDEAEAIRMASLLHDIGKIAIPDAILNKPARLTAEEFAIVTEHSRCGYELLKDSDRPLLQLAASIALSHHERWDGSGYPHRLAKEAIPLAGRIVAIADVFDALSSPRIYKPALKSGEVMRIMREGRGSHFDPELLDHFLVILEESQFCYIN
jgi:putative two-component system response regulator